MPDEPAAAAVEIDREMLCIGDEFALQMIPDASGTTGFVSANPADGSAMHVFAEALRGDPDLVHPSRPLLSRFLLHTANQYRACRNVRKYAERLGGAAGERQRLAAAERNEAVVNATEMELATGQRAIYGQTYQFLSPACDMFLSMKTQPVSGHSTALRCTMSAREDRSNRLWWSVRPAFHTRTEGEPVQFGDTVVLESNTMPGMFMHTSLSGDRDQETAEVDAFEEATRFRIVPVAKHWEQCGAKAVRAGSYVKLYQPQYQTYLYREHTLDRSGSHDTNQAVLMQPVVDAKPGEKTRATLAVDMLWQLSIPTMQWSGAMVEHNAHSPMKFSLREVVNLGFLSESESGELSFVSEDIEPNTHWYLCPFNPTAKKIEVERTGFYIENAKSGNKLGIGPPIDAPERRSNLRCLVSKQAPLEDDIFVLRELPPDWVSSFGKLLPSYNLLQQFCASVKSVGSLSSAVRKKVQVGDGEEQTASAARNLLQETPALLSLHTRFLLPDTPTEPPWSGPVPAAFEAILIQMIVSNDGNVFTRDGVVNRELQHQLTGLQVPQFLLEELLPALLEMVPKELIAKKVFGHHLLRTIRYCFRLLALLGRSHRKNSRYLFSQIDRIVAMGLEDSFGSEVSGTITDIFQDMPELMRKCDDKLINALWDMVQKERNVKFLECLCVLLVHDGLMMVKSNQDRLLKTVQGQMSQDLFSFKLSASDEGTKSLKMRLHTKAMLKAAAVKQQSKEGYHAALNADKKLDVGDLLEYEKQLDFHRGLIKMVAFLCTGRHRGSIEFFLADPRTNLSYEAVLNRMTNPLMPASVRAAYTQLMKTMFIDQEPHELSPPTMPSRIMPPLEDDAEQVRKRLGHVDKVGGGGPPSGSPTKGFTDLKEEIIGVFNAVERVQVGDVNASRYLCEMVDLAHQMMLFGLFDRKEGGVNTGVLVLGEETKRLGHSLLHLLNGHTDNIEGLEYDADNDGHIDEDDLELVRFDTRWAETTTVMELRKAVMSLIIDLFGLRASKRVQILIEACNENIDHFQDDVVLSPSAEIATHKKNGKQSKSPRSSKSANPMFKSGDGVEDPTAITMSNPIHAGDDDDDGVIGGTDAQDPTSGSPSVSRFWSMDDQLCEAGFINAPVSPQAPSSGGSPRWRRNRPVEVVSEPMRIAREAMVLAKKERVYDDMPEDETGADAGLTHSLLDLLRYNDDTDLCFGAFNALVFFQCQDFVFTETLKKVNVLGTDEAARNFLKARADVTTYRRLRKFATRSDEDCQALTAHTQKIIRQWCTDSQYGTKASEGQKLLRHLMLEEYALRIIRMRYHKAYSVSPEPFHEMMRATIQLVSAFCRHNGTNQTIFAAHMTPTLLDLMKDKHYYVDAAVMLAVVVEDNEVISLAHAELLVDAVSELSLSADHGRCMEVLVLLEKLLVANGKHIETSQVTVCKGAFVCRSLIDLDGHLAKDAWGKGKAMSRVECIQRACSGERSNDVKRCQLATDYYAKCLELLGLCARGDMPATELMCAAVLPFEECVDRLNEMYTLKQTGGSFVYEIRAELITFFIEVYVDTTSEHILLTLRRPRNGLWSVMEGDEDQPLAQLFLTEMKDRLSEAEAEHSSRVQPGQGAKTGSTHLFEECVLFFIHYCCGSQAGVIAPEEYHTVEDILIELKDVSTQALESKTAWSDRESSLLQQVKEVCKEFLGKGNIRSSAVVLNTLADGVQQLDLMDVCGNEQAWRRFVLCAVSSIPVRNVSETKRLVGKGMMTLARLIWEKVDQKGENGRYAGFLVKPLRTRLAALKVDLMKGARDDIPKLLTVLDSVRAIPYSATAYSEEKLDFAFQQFADVEELDCDTNPYLAAVQREMVSQGWPILCFEMLASDELQDLHLTALRLLLAITGGGNVDVQDGILAQIDDATSVEQEIAMGACRKLLRRSVADLKSARKSAAIAKAQSESNGEYAVVVNDEINGHAVETLTLLSNLCKNSHHGMQEYIRKQPGHQERIDIIADVISYISQIERDIRDEVKDSHASHRTVKADLSTRTVGEQLKAKAHNVSHTLNRSHAAFYLLEKLASGPNWTNQTAIANSELIPVINRILTYSKYDSLSDIDSHKSSLQTAKGQIHGQVSRVLLILLEGVPKPLVVKRILAAVDWSVFYEHLAIMKTIMLHGRLQEPNEDQVIRKSEDGEDHSHNHKVRKKQKDTKSPTLWSAVPKKVVNLDTHVYAEWIRKEAFRFFTVIAKLRIAGEELEESGSPTYKNCLAPLQVVLQDGEMMAFFGAHVGQVEVVRDGILERLFYFRPANYHVLVERAMIERKITSVIDEAPRDDSTEKLEHFLEGANEIALTVSNQDKVAQQFSDPSKDSGQYKVPTRWGSYLTHFYMWFERTRPTMVVSLLMCVNLMLSYTRCDDVMNISTELFFDKNATAELRQCEVPGSWERKTYARSETWPLPIVGPIGFEVFVVLGAVHLVLTLARLYAFALIRLPVIVGMDARRQRLQYLHSKHVVGVKDREDFVARCVLVYGLPYKVPKHSWTIFSVLRGYFCPDGTEAAADTSKHVLLDEVYAQKLLRKYGDIGGAYVVKVPQLPPYHGLGNNSWAVVKFEKLTSTREIKNELERQNGVLRCQANAVPGAQVERVSIDDLTSDDVERSTTLKNIIDEMELDYKIGHGEKENVFLSGLTIGINGLSKGINTVANITGIAKVLPVNHLMDVLIAFRKDAEVHMTLVDVAFSVLGYTVTPLCFSYHLFTIMRFSGARIVVLSLSHNVTRLAVTLLLCLLFSWVFAVIGLVVFPEKHDLEAVENEGGPCGNLLTCFVAYSYSGLLMEGLDEYIPDKVFPVQASDLVGHDAAKTAWELVFGMITMFVGSIITGIICDTFGELRTAQDDAEAYRQSTNFITGIPYTVSHTTAQHPGQLSTSYIHYTWLMLYLRERKAKDLTPTEAMVKDKIENGDVSWLPDGRSSFLEGKSLVKSDKGMERMDQALSDLALQQQKLHSDMVRLEQRVEETNGATAAALEAMAAQLRGGGGGSS